MEAISINAAINIPTKLVPNLVLSNYLVKHYKSLHENVITKEARLYVLSSITDYDVVKKELANNIQNKFFVYIAVYFESRHNRYIALSRDTEVFCREIFSGIVRGKFFFSKKKV